MKKLTRSVSFRKWYEIILDHGSVIVTLLCEKARRNEFSYKGIYRADVQACLCFCENAAENAIVIQLVVLGVNVDTAWCDEIEVEQPSLQCRGGIAID